MACFHQYFRKKNYDAIRRRLNSIYLHLSSSLSPIDTEHFVYTCIHHLNDIYRKANLLDCFLDRTKLTHTMNTHIMINIQLIPWCSAFRRKFNISTRAVHEIRPSPAPHLISVYVSLGTWLLPIDQVAWYFSIPESYNLIIAIIAILHHISERLKNNSTYLPIGGLFILSESMRLLLLHDGIPLFNTSHIALGKQCHNIQSFCTFKQYS